MSRETSGGIFSIIPRFLLPKSCYQTCTVAQGCGFAGAAFDADKFACQGGLCVYLGYLSDAESASQNVTYVCR